MNQHVFVVIAVIVIVILYAFIGKIEKLLDKCETVVRIIRRETELQNGAHKLGEIDLDDKDEIFNIKHERIEIPVGFLVELLDLYDPGIYMGNTQPQSRQEKLDEIMGYMHEEEMEDYKEIVAKQDTAYSANGPAQHT